MTHILHIDSSVRAVLNDNPAHNSISKQLAERFIASFKTHCATAEYTYRDVGMNPPDFINQQWIGAVFTPEAKRSAAQRQQLALSDQLIAEVSAADLIVISAPMYNYGMPAQLKAWFDQIVRINKTFDFDLNRGDTPLAPLLSGKTLVILTSCGEFGFEEGGVNELHGHLVPHLRTLSKYLGVEQIFEVASEYQEFADNRHRQSLQQALAKSAAMGLQLAQHYAGEATDV